MKTQSGARISLKFCVRSNLFVFIAHDSGNQIENGDSIELSLNDKFCLLTTCGTHSNFDRRKVFQNVPS